MKNIKNYLAVVIVSTLFFVPSFLQADSWKFSCGDEKKQIWKLKLRMLGANEKQIEIKKILAYGNDYIIALNVYSDQQEHGTNYWMSTETVLIDSTGRIKWRYVHSEHGIKDALNVYGKERGANTTLYKYGDLIYRTYSVGKRDGGGYKYYLTTLNSDGSLKSVKFIKGKGGSLDQKTYIDNEGNTNLYRFRCLHGKCTLQINRTKVLSLKKTTWNDILKFSHINDPRFYNDSRMIGPHTFIYPYEMGKVGNNILSRLINKFTSPKKKNTSQKYYKYMLVNLSDKGKVVWKKKLSFEVNMLLLKKIKDGYMGFYVPADSVIKGGYRRKVVKNIVQIRLDNLGGIIEKKTISLPNSFSIFSYKYPFGTKSVYVSGHANRVSSKRIILITKSGIDIKKYGTGWKPYINQNGYLMSGMNNNLYLCR